MKKVFLLTIFTILMTIKVLGQHNHIEWHAVPTDQVTFPAVVATKYALFTTNENQLFETLKLIRTTGKHQLFLNLPMPNLGENGFLTFDIYDAKRLPADVQAKYPNKYTIYGKCTEDARVHSIISYDSDLGIFQATVYYHSRIYFLTRMMDTQNQPYYYFYLNTDIPKR